MAAAERNTALILAKNKAYQIDFDPIGGYLCPG